MFLTLSLHTVLFLKWSRAMFLFLAICLYSIFVSLLSFTHKSEMDRYHLKNDVNQIFLSRETMSSLKISLKKVSLFEE